MQEPPAHLIATLGWHNCKSGFGAFNRSLATRLLPLIVVGIWRPIQPCHDGLIVIRPIELGAWLSSPSRLAAKSNTDLVDRVLQLFLKFLMLTKGMKHDEDSVGMPVAIRGWPKAVSPLLSLDIRKQPCTGRAPRRNRLANRCRSAACCKPARSGEVTSFAPRRRDPPSRHPHRRSTLSRLNHNSGSSAHGSG